MSKNTPFATSDDHKLDGVLLLHRAVALLATPFLLVSIVLAVGLTHTQLLSRLSEAIYPSLPIPPVHLDEPVQAGSWEQALKVAKLVTGLDGQVITTRDEHTAIVQGFAQHTHDPAVAKTNPQTQVLVDTRTMSVVRVQDKTTSLVSQAHGVHAIRFFGIHGFSIATISALALLALLLSGGVLAWRDGKAGKSYGRSTFWHVRLGRVIGVFVVVISLTTLDFEFSLLGPADRTVSHPIPVVQLNEPVRPGSLDQARRLAELVTGAVPRAVFIRKNGDDLKFSQAGDGIGGKSVWLNANTMSINRITDWRNDSQALKFILHDGRFLGGMNALNLYDVVALILLLLVLGGLMLFWRKRRLSDTRQVAATGV